MRKIFKKLVVLVTLVVGIGIAFTSCNPVVDEPGKTIAMYNSGNTTLVVIPTTRDKNENTDEAVMLYPKRTVKMTFSAEYGYLWFAVNPNIFKTDTGDVVIGGGRYYMTGIQEGKCYNVWLTSGGYVDCFSGRVTEEQMESLKWGTLAKDTIIEYED